MTIQAVRSPEQALADPLSLDDGCVVEVEDPELGWIRMAGVPYRLDVSPGRIRAGAPRVGQHTVEVRAEAARLRSESPQATIPGRPPPPRGQKLDAPLEGITVLDLTAWWAGPSGAALFGALGAEVIHVESTRRIDGMRTAGGFFVQAADEVVRLWLRGPGTDVGLDPLDALGDVGAEDGGGRPTMVQDRRPRSRLR